MDDTDRGILVVDRCLSLTIGGGHVRAADFANVIRADVPETVGAGAHIVRLKRDVSGGHGNPRLDIAGTDRTARKSRFLGHRRALV